ncbi:MAG: hypothetical protein KU37_09015 [Sulfuricurvum sp. PC08-66]|nr:MAG: hypothetical protein KU37_09015 [Sulfuricurvum sp. PC08-66]
MKIGTLSKYLFALLLLLFIASTFYLIRVTQHLKELDRLQRFSEHISSSHEKLNAIEFGFLFEKSLHYREALQQAMEHFKSQNESLYYAQCQYVVKERNSDDPLYKDIQMLHQTIGSYFDEISSIITLQTQMGLDHEQGLYGDLRRDAHLLEERIGQLGAHKILVTLLQIRRHEKDFMLRGLEGYITAYEKKIVRIKQELRASYPQYYDDLGRYIDTYREKFIQFTTIYKAIGYGANIGALGRTAQYRATYKSLKERIIDTIQERKAPLEEQQNILLFVLSVLFMALTLIILRFRRELEHAKERNPLTDLNGNKRIKHYLNALKTNPNTRIIVYFDFDYFKPFNDHFGFKKGDEAIIAFADLLRIEFGFKNHFIGHIGGDDFIVAMHKVDFESVHKRVKSIQKSFRRITKKYYSTEEIKQGWMREKDRFGEVRELPLLSVSASIIEIRENRVIADIEEISTLFSLIKENAKLSSISAASII